jgi:hypothetical protein
MLNSSTKDALERLNHWIDVLEERIHVLLDTNDLELMSPAQREQAASRHLTVMLHFMQLCWEYEELSDDDDDDDPAIVDAIIDGDDIDEWK